MWWMALLQSVPEFRVARMTHRTLTRILVKLAKRNESKVTRVNAIQDFGDVLTSLDVAHGAKLASALDLGAYLGQVEGLLLLAAGEYCKLGELLQSARRLSEAQLEDALAEQRRCGDKLGEILLRRGLLCEPECEVALAFQQRRSGQARSVTKLFLGNVLVATGDITREQLADALQLQLKQGGRLGEALVAGGHSSIRQVKRGLGLQRKLVAAVLVIAMEIASSLAVANERPSISSGSAEVSNVKAAYATRTQGERRVMRLLIADDHNALRAELRSVLKGENDIEVVGEAVDGEGALARVRELTADLVLMDIVMPGMNGIEATRRILEATPGVKVLVFSSCLEWYFVEKILANGALGYVSKSAGREELLLGLRTVARGKPFLCRATAAIMAPVKEEIGTIPGEAALAHCEIEVLRRRAEGESTENIALRLQLGAGVVEVHLRNAMRKLGLRDLDQLLHYAKSPRLVSKSF